jgi:hypothetical protein
LNDVGDDKLRAPQRRKSNKVRGKVRGKITFGKVIWKRSGSGEEILGTVAKQVQI